MRCHLSAHFGQQENGHFVESAALKLITEVICPAKNRDQLTSNDIIEARSKSLGMTKVEKLSSGPTAEDKPSLASHLAQPTAWCWSLLELRVCPT